MSKAKLKEPAGIVSQDVSCNGLFDCRIEHEVKQSMGEFTWRGPKLTPELWHKILAFFRDSYKKTNSESQVRLFLNKQLGTWDAWAFPQKSRGMTTEELSESTDEFRSQRARFGDEWVPFGTVHHHCSASAFQSGVDKDNEHNQDGLHITVGNLNSKFYDIHVRFYRRGNCFDPDVSEFWDVSDKMSEIPEWCIHLLPDGIGNRLARTQMCIPPPDTVVPDPLWMANLIEDKPKIIQTGSGFGSAGFSHADWESELTSYSGKLSGWRHQALTSRIDEILNEPRVDGDIEMLYDELQLLSGYNHQLMSAICDVCNRSNSSFDDVCEYVEHRVQQMLQAEAEEERRQIEKQTQELNGEGGVAALD